MKKTCYILLVLTAVLTLCGCGIHKIDDPATAEKFTKAVEELGFTTEKETVDGGDVVTATYGKETAVVSYGQYDEMSSVTQMYDYFLKNASDNKDYTVEEGEGKNFVAISGDYMFRCTVRENTIIAATTKGDEGKNLVNKIFSELKC